MTTPPLRKSISRSPLRRGFHVVLLVLGLFALLPTARAVDPPPDGGYPNGNTAEGENALFSDTTGYWNTAIGFDALFFNTTANVNVAVGYQALYNNATGSENVAVGWSALYFNTTGNLNTAVGGQALQQNTTGNYNAASGTAALLNNGSGSNNTATGFQALTVNQTGDNNTANGFDALLLNSTGNNNTATGANALFGGSHSGGSNGATGSNNTANGVSALESNITGNNNTASGFAALIHNNGNFNTADGFNALFDNTTGINNTASGSAALASNTTGSGNIAVGRQAGINLSTGSNNIDIGAPGLAGESGKIRIGKTGTQTATFIAGIRGVTIASGLGVVVSSNGQLGTVTSSARFKNDIKPMEKVSEAILALKPVTFRYKHELDPDGIPQFGLVAEEVEKVNPDLVVRDADGKVNTVRYEAVNAMLLNEFLKEHQKVQKLEAALAAVNERLKAQDAKIDKVNAKVESTTPASQVALNNP